jgi:alkanesulfonate monooxygenase SsuD/methylene tetrahydromethanopterin reductase-like flavin-dependent oxidoreductase (luciferase family)
VVEKMALLDHLSGGRAILGLGRGLARVEYEHFGIEMSSSRDRFDEAARMIVDGLEKGFVEGSGPYYPKVRTEVRPRPLASFKDRLYAVGISPESVEAVARLGARLMVFSQQPWEMFAQGTLASYRAHWARMQQGPPPPPLTGDLMFCHEDAGEAERLALEYMSNYYLSIIRHYELLGTHLEGVKGYELYRDASHALRAVGAENSAKIYCGIQTWGTPDQILEKLRARRRLLGDFELALIAHYGGMPLDVAERSIRLFAERVLPELRKG